MFLRDIYTSLLMRLIGLLKSQNASVVVILAAILPGVSDTRSMINSFTFRNEKLAFKCQGESRLFFTRPGKNLLISPGGPIPDYYNKFGNINRGGLDVLRRALKCKLVSIHLPSGVWLVLFQ